MSRRRARSTATNSPPPATDSPALDLPKRRVWLLALTAAGLAAWIAALALLAWREA